MVYRPTVRYSDEFKTYVDELFRATTLDRNQIIRAALFTAAHSNEFQLLLTKYKKKDVPLPSASWLPESHHLWMELNPLIQEGGMDVNVNSTRTESINNPVRKTTREPNKHSNPSTQRREREIPSEGIRVTNQGGITIKFG